MNGFATRKRTAASEESVTERKRFPRSEDGPSRIDEPAPAAPQELDVGRGEDSVPSTSKQSPVGESQHLNQEVPVDPVEIQERIEDGQDDRTVSPHPPTEYLLQPPFLNFWDAATEQHVQRLYGRMADVARDEGVPLVFSTVQPTIGSLVHALVTLDYSRKISSENRIIQPHLLSNIDQPTTSTSDSTATDTPAERQEEPSIQEPDSQPGNAYNEDEVQEEQKQQEQEQREEQDGEEDFVVHPHLSSDPLTLTSRDILAQTLAINNSSSDDFLDNNEIPVTADIDECIGQDKALKVDREIKIESDEAAVDDRERLPPLQPQTPWDPPTLAAPQKTEKTVKTEDESIESEGPEFVDSDEEVPGEDEDIGEVRDQSDPNFVDVYQRNWRPPRPPTPFAWPSQMTEDTEEPIEDAGDFATDKKSIMTGRKRKAADTDKETGTKEAEMPTRNVLKRKAAENAEHKIEQMRKDAEAAFKAGSRECGKCKHHGVHNPVHRHVCHYRDCVCSLGCDKVQIKRDLTANEYNSRMAAKRKRADVVGGLREADQPAPIAGTPGPTTSGTIPERQDPPQHPKKLTNGAPAGDGVPVVEEQPEEADEQPGPATRYPKSQRSSSPDNEE